MKYEEFKQTVFGTICEVLDHTKQYSKHYTSMIYNIYKTLSYAKKVQKEQDL